MRNTGIDRAATHLVKELLAIPIQLAPPGSVDVQDQSTSVDEIFQCIDNELSHEPVDIQKLKHHIGLLKSLVTDEPCGSSGDDVGMLGVATEFDSSMT